VDEQIREQLPSYPCLLLGDLKKVLPNSPITGDLLFFAPKSPGADRPEYQAGVQLASYIAFHPSVTSSLKGKASFSIISLLDFGTCGDLVIKVEMKADKIGGGYTLKNIYPMTISNDKYFDRNDPEACAAYLAGHKRLPASFTPKVQGLERSIEDIKYITTLKNPMQCAYVYGSNSSYIQTMALAIKTHSLFKDISDASDKIKRAPISNYSALLSSDPDVRMTVLDINLKEVISAISDSVTSDFKTNMVNKRSKAAEGAALKKYASLVETAGLIVTSSGLFDANADELSRVIDTLAREHLPVLEEQAVMDVEDVAAGSGRSRKVAGSNGGEHHAPSPSKPDSPGKEKRTTRRGGKPDSPKKKLDLGKDDAQPKPAAQPNPAAQPKPKKAAAEPTTVALSKKAAAPIDPNFLTPLAQAQLASFGGTPASTPDRPGTLYSACRCVNIVALVPRW